MTATWTDPAACDDRADETSREGTGFEVDHTPAVPDGYKLCTKCGIAKAHSEFGRDRTAADGLTWQCKACRAAYRADRRANAPVARWLRGEIDDVPDGIEDWLIGQVDRGGDDACWTWQGAMHNHGYGFTSFDGVMVYAHHVALRFWTGVVVPNGLHTDHLCRNRLCCNPSHLEVVPPRTNTLRGIGPSAENARKTHCDNGHELTDTNTYIDANGWRRCQACNRDRTRAFRARTRNGNLTPLQKLNRGIFLRTLTFNVTERSAQICTSRLGTWTATSK